MRKQICSKKMMALILCSVMATGLMSGCGVSAKQEETASTQTQEAASAPTKETTGTQTQETASTQTQKSTSTQENAAQISFHGKQLTIILASNPTTGFSWEYKIADEKLLKFDQDDYQQESLPSTDETAEMMTGVGGADTFTFEGLSEGTTTITFDYAQHWDGGDKGDVTTVTVQTDKDGNILSAK